MAEKVTIGNAELWLGDCLEVLRTMPDCSADSIVTDPPYGLGKEPDALAMLADWLATGHHDVKGSGFMGKAWDAFVPQPALWRECLRVLKPGGHLLTFAGTRTHDLMTLGLRIAGFEIRDTIMWVYGSGFPKSLDVSKAIDKAAGAERTERLAPKPGHEKFVGRDNVKSLRESGALSGEGGYSRPWMYDPQKVENAHWDFAPATDAARQWQGWGTALKPALETVTVASKPYTDEQELGIILSNLIRLEACLWLLSSASAVEKSSTSSQSEYGAACAIAQWSADEITNTRADLCGQMDTSLFELATTTSLSIVSSWRRTLEESWSDGSTSTTETKSSTTTDWRTLKFSLSQITPASIIKACSLPGGFSANASTAERHFNASLSLLQSILTLSATEPAISQAQHEHLGAGVTPNLDPCIMARKPLDGTVAANVLAHETGALNIDGCRVEGGTRPLVVSDRRNGNGVYRDGLQGSRAVEGGTTAGRWPANLIHDGSDEVVALFPETGPASGAQRNNNTSLGSSGSGVFCSAGAFVGQGHADNGGSAARFFYCAKASKKDREEGLDHMPAVHRPNGNKWTDQDYRVASVERPPSAESGPRRNTHPTVKPTDLMRYLCRLVTPPGGAVLDPFMGSGSTGKAAMQEGFAFIGIERESNYFDIACRRIENEQRQAGLAV